MSYSSFIQLPGYEGDAFFFSEDANYTLRPQDKFPAFLDPSRWGRKEDDAGYTIFVSSDGTPLNVFRAAMIWLNWMTFPHAERHDSGWNWHRHAVEEEYETYGSISVIGDYRNVSYTREALHKILVEDFEARATKVKTEYSRLTLPHYGEMLTLRVLDSYEGQVTEEARWFFLESGWYEIYAEIYELEDEAEFSMSQRFLREMTEGQGKGVNYKTIYPDGTMTTQEDYRGLPAEDAPMPDNPPTYSDRIALKRDELIHSDLAYAISEGAYSYRHWLKEPIEQDSDQANELALKLGGMLGDMPPFVSINDYRHEVYIRHDLFVAWFWLQAGLIDVEALNDDGEPDEEGAILKLLIEGEWSAEDLWQFVGSAEYRGWDRKFRSDREDFELYSLLGDFETDNDR